MTEAQIKELIRKLKRKKTTESQIREQHKNNEMSYTYWGARSLGYLQGEISAIENILDIIDENWENNYDKNN